MKSAISRSVAQQREASARLLLRAGNRTSSERVEMLQICARIDRRKREIAAALARGELLPDPPQGGR